MKDEISQANKIIDALCSAKSEIFKTEVKFNALYQLGVIEGKRIEREKRAARL